MEKKFSAHQSQLPPARQGALRRHWLVGAACLTLAFMPVAQTAQAVAQGAGGPGPCKINGALVDPPLPPGVPSRWTFIANFDHPNSATNVVTCLVTKTPAGTTYDVGRHCTVVATNHPNRRRFGGGTARFDGEAYLECTINPTPLPLSPPNVWVNARLSVPTNLTTTTSTLVDSQDINFNVHNDPTCVWTLNSRYDDFDFAHQTTSNCVSFVSIESHLLNGPAMEGRHRVTTMSATNFYGPAQEVGGFTFSPVFAFRIALPGEIYTLDWLLIDPDSVKCCGQV